MSDPIVNLDAMKAGFDRRCRKGCQFSSKVHKVCPEHGGRSKKIMTLEELAIRDIEQAHAMRQLKKEICQLQRELKRLAPYDPKRIMRFKHAK